MNDVLPFYSFYVTEVPPPPNPLWAGQQKKRKGVRLDGARRALARSSLRSF